MYLNTMLIGNKLIDMGEVRCLRVDATSDSVIYVARYYDGTTDTITVPRGFKDTPAGKAALALNETYKDVQFRCATGIVEPSDTEE